MLTCTAMFRLLTASLDQPMTSSMATEMSQAIDRMQDNVGQIILQQNFKSNTMFIYHHKIENYIH